MDRKIIILVAMLVWLANVTVGAKNIINTQYWLDGDVENAQVLLSQIDLSGVHAGIHTISVRAQDSEQAWSAPVTRYFLYSPIEEKASGITDRQYWLDGKVSETKGLGTVVDLAGMCPGLHSLSVRVKDNLGKWSAPVTRYFLVPRQEAEKVITNYCYFFDNKDAEMKLGVVTDEEPVFAIDASMLYPGEHTITWLVCDSNGAWSEPLTESFELVYEAIMGDVNDSGSLDITDVVAIANYVMGDTPSVFNAGLADYNKSGSVDITDVVAIANVVMGY